MLQSFYRDKLNYVGQRIYDDLCEGICQHRKDIRTSFSPDFGRILRAVNYDHPEFFYVNWMDSFRLSTIGCFSSLHLSYIYDEPEISSIQQRIKATGKTIPGISDFGKVKGVHDWFIMHVSYDHDGLQSAIRSPRMFSAAGPLIHQKAVCEGVSKLACCFLREKNVDCRIVTGYSKDGTPHAWIEHKSDSKYSYSDITYDMGLYGAARTIPYNYFNLDFGEISQDHTFEQF